VEILVEKEALAFQKLLTGLDLSEKQEFKAAKYTLCFQRVR
jgi:hypothetical protein